MSLRILWLARSDTFFTTDAHALRSLGAIVVKPQFAGGFLEEPSQELADEFDLSPCDLEHLAMLTLPPAGFPGDWRLLNRLFDAVVLDQAADFTLWMQNFRSAIVVRRYGVSQDWAGLAAFVPQAQAPGDAREGLPANPDPLFIRQLNERTSPVTVAFAARVEPHPDMLHAARSVVVPLCVAEDRTEGQRWRGGASAAIFSPLGPAGATAYASFIRARRSLLASYGVRLLAECAPTPTGHPAPAFARIFSTDRYWQDLIHCAAVIDAGERVDLISRPILDALSVGVPVLFPRGGYFASLVDDDAAGAFGSDDELSGLIAAMTSGDEKVLRGVQETSGRLREALAPDHAAAAWRDVLGDVSRPALRPAIPRALTVVAGRHASMACRNTARILAGSLARTLAAAGECRAPRVGIRLARDLVVDEVSNEAPVVAPCNVVWRTIGRDAAEVIDMRAGRRWRAHPDAALLATLEDLSPSSRLLIVLDRTNGIVSPAVPYILALPGFPAWAHRPGALSITDPLRQTIGNALAILVDDPNSAELLHTVYGIAESRIALVPRIVDDLPRRPAPLSSSPFFVWVPDIGADRANTDRAMDALTLLHLRYPEMRGLLLAETDEVVDRFTRFDMGKAGLTLVRRPNRDTFRESVAGARFLWMPDVASGNDPLIVEAAALGVPACAADSSARRLLNDNLGLGATLFDIAHLSSTLDAFGEMVTTNAETRAALASPKALDRAAEDFRSVDLWDRLRAWL